MKRKKIVDKSAERMIGEEEPFHSIFNEK